MADAALRRSESAQGSRRAATRWIFPLLLCVACCGFTALGVWQLYRLQWKLDLIERVESRIHASPSALPAASEWSRINAVRDEYRHVRLVGHFVAARDTRVQALTQLGAGFWVLSPFELGDGNFVLVNRGYVPADFRGDIAPSSATSITGLLRITEPRGGFLRDNVPADDRWYSRDAVAIASARGLANAAPLFIDADAGQESDGVEWPRGGLTVTNFPNNHLGYALTWFALAALCAWAMWYFVSAERKMRSVG